MQPGNDGQRDNDDADGLRGDAELADLNQFRREHAGEQLRVGAPDNHRRIAQYVGNTDRCDQQVDERGKLDFAQDHAFQQEAETCGTDDAQRHRYIERESELGNKSKGDKRADHHNVAVGKVQHTEGFVHHRDTDRHQRIQAAVCQTIQYLLKQHLVLPPFYK